MTRIPDLRFGVQALQMGLVRRDQLLEGASVWLNDLDMGAIAAGPVRTLRSILVEFGFINAEEAATVEAALQADEGAPSGVDPQVRRELLDLRPPIEILGWLQSLVERPPAMSAFRPLPHDERYEVRGEIARGGLGCVLEGLDRHLGREVALKVVQDGMPPEVTERFVREARITSKLDHPNIVPVHDFDEMPDGRGGRRLVLCMKRIRGRDLGTLLGAVKRGEPDVQRWTRARLLAMFQDICLGVAYAHSKGVLHRDLKPSNVMIGEFGETLVVDWGLAKEAGEATSPARPSSSSDSAAVPGAGELALTMDGDLLGTPLYMSPEQAAGRHSDMDPRSDVYSLGGILYTILTHRPPFQGGTREEVIKSVLSGRIESPSVLVERVRSAAGSAAPFVPIVPLPEQIPPDLDAICMKSLACRREDRYATAIELHDDIQLFLEGAKERERNHRLAEEAVARAKVAVERQEWLEEEAKRASQEAVRTGREMEAKPLAEKTEWWALLDRERELGSAAMDAFSEANAELTLALGFEKKHEEARRLRAESYWKRYLAAEEAGDEKEMRFNRAIVERYNDGPLDALLKGDGKLTVRTRAYPCRCLLDGRMVNPEDLVWQGYHPFSGRALDGHERAESLPELEPNGPVKLKVHAASCEPAPVQGADVWLFRYEEIGRRMMPMTPDLADAEVGRVEGIEAKDGERRKRPIPDDVVNGTFEKASPYRPKGPGVWLGRTPIENRTLPMGSYLLLVAHEGRAPIRVPIAIPRCGHLEQDVSLFLPEEIPQGFMPISNGPFTFQGDPKNSAADAQTRFVDDVFFARHPVNCREYCEFLNDLATTRPEEAARRAPREAQESGGYWPGPPYAVPTAEWLAKASAELKTKAKRLENTVADWEEDWPVSCVSWEDGMAYAAWKREKGATLMVLPHEVDWEKSARGTDGRFYPWGRYWDDRWANGNRSHPDNARPARESEFPSDESPYGVRGMCGNIVQACLNSPGYGHPAWRVARGGSFANGGSGKRVTTRTGLVLRLVYSNAGFRAALVVRLARTP